MNTVERQQPLRIFCGYAHDDSALFEQLQKALAVLIRQKQVVVWHYGELLPGTEWDSEIEWQVHTADIILLLVSPSFIASEYCWSKEMQWAITRHASGEARVLPILLKPTSGWESTPLGRLQALPANAKPITSWYEQDSALANVVSGLQKVILYMQSEESYGVRNRSYEQQRKINEMKDQFLLNVNHELRTPLTVLGGYLELLKEFYEHMEPQERKQLLAHALASKEELADLINRVLDTISVETDIPRIKPQTIYIHKLLQETLVHLAPEDVEAYTIRLNVPPQVVVWADPLLLRQVLQNLFSNIFKYVPQQTEIHIEVTQVTPSSPVCLSIQDTGPGIPPEELPLLFEKFVRLKRDLAGATRGMGLGLYICKQLVEAMKGHIWAESSGRAGEGCRFCLILPPLSSSSF